MRFSLRLPAVALFVACLCFPISSWGRVHTSRPSRTSVKFLAQGVAVYSSFSGNQTEYLVEIVGRDQQTHYARLVYQRPRAHPELTDQILGVGSIRTLPLLRSEECDDTYSNLSTIWTPGYRNTVTRAEALHFYQGVNRPSVSPGEMLPCYVLPAGLVRWRGFEAVIR